MSILNTSYTSTAIICDLLSKTLRIRLHIEKNKKVKKYLQNYACCKKKIMYAFESMHYVPFHLPAHEEFENLCCFLSVVVTICILRVNCL